MDEGTNQQIIVTLIFPLMDLVNLYSLPENTIGQQIYKYRKLNNLYQKDIAEMLGVCIDSVTGYEKERTTPSTSIIKKLIKLSIIKG